MCRVTFLHPDLGIGGAERLIVDAAMGLKRKGHSVSIVTTHHDPNRCFDETANGDLQVTVVGNWIPRNIFNRFNALMSYIRMIYAALFIVIGSDLPDVVICDLVSVAVPVLKLRIKNVIFYCHYPDQLLSRPEGTLKKLYRIPLNWLEELTLGKASLVFVNSQYTSNVFIETFKSIKFKPDVLYPSLNTQFFDSVKVDLLPDVVNEKCDKDCTVFLSINRYERKKNLGLAIEALHELKELINYDEWIKVKLIMVGGYDGRITENIDYFEELKELTSKLDLDDNVIFLKSLKDNEKVSLLKMCKCLIYTPENEHFGIVPLEAMYLGKPVIAVNNGGPTESICNGETGFLCDSNKSAFADAMKKFLVDKDLAVKFGEAGKNRIEEMFSFDEFSNKLDNAITSLLSKKDD